MQRQRLLLGQQYQLAIQQAVAENNSELAKSLYANLALQYSKALLSFTKSMV